ncbi:hypothetical protein QQF64_034261 [Cirrhinus molitorella]|uniref:Integrase catalytic domain-containing protein n=1 Tax=Cirrhinus molitorella TaxID=172907 RepID=A0ABR3MW78_9TELE
MANGPCFSSAEWQQFSQLYDFKHVTSSPEYAQSNGKAEKGVHILKQLLRNAADSKSDPYLALLNYRTSPSECGLAPAEMLMNRRLCTTLPSCSKQKEHVKMKQKLQQLKEKQKFYYDRTAKPLQPLAMDDVVRIRSDENWKRKATVMDEVAPRSYTVKTDDGQILRLCEGAVPKDSSRGEITFGGTAGMVEVRLVSATEDVDHTSSILQNNPGGTAQCVDYGIGKSGLSLPTLRKILRSHYQERSATELYKQLTTEVQNNKETPQNFLIRAMDLRQKILFASQEAESNLKYDPVLVQSMFMHTILTGLQSDNIKSDIQPYLLQPTTSDELLVMSYELLNIACGHEKERQEKRRQTPQRPAGMHTVQSSDISGDRKQIVQQYTVTLPPNVLSDLKGLKADMVMLKDLKTEMAQIRESIQKTDHHTGYNSPVNMEMDCEAAQHSMNAQSQFAPWNIGSTATLHHNGRLVPDYSGGPGVVDASSKGKNTASIVTGVEVMNIFVLAAEGTKDKLIRTASFRKKQNWTEQGKDQSLHTQPKQTQVSKTITDKKRNVMGKKHSMVSELVGKKCLVNCYIQGQRTQVLWDTGSQVSAIDETWKADNLPDIWMRDIAEIVDPDNPLQIEAANGTEIPYVGWVEVSLGWELNCKTHPDRQPIPRVQDVMDGLGGNTMFSLLDQGKAYHQGFMAKDSKHLDCIRDPLGII